MLRSPFLQSMLIKRDKMMIMAEDVIGDAGGDMVVENMRRCILVPLNQWLDIIDVQYEKGRLLHAVLTEDLTTFDLYFRYC